MFSLRDFSLAVFLSAIAAPHYVSADACGPAIITSLADAEAVRKCPEIYGNITIYYNVSTVNLDGVKAIHGNLSAIPACEECGQTEVFESLSSDSLTTIDGHFNMTENMRLTNITLPNLTTVNDIFLIDKVNNLTYLDITSLESVGSFYLEAVRLESMKHSALHNVTGAEARKSKFIIIGNTNLESVDSLFQQPMIIESVLIVNPSKLERLTVGLAEVEELYIGRPDIATESKSTTLVLGGPQTKEMKLGILDSLKSLNGIERLPSLEKLTVEAYHGENNSYEHLHLPFDQLTSLTLYHEETLRWLSVPPSATEWSNFRFTAQFGNTNLNLSTEYRIDEKQEMVRSWYWPQKDIMSITVGGQVTNAFFDSFLAFQDTFTNFTGRPKVLDTFYLSELGGGNIDCAPFFKLQAEGVLPFGGKKFSCGGKYENFDNSSDTSRGSRHRCASSLAIATVVIWGFGYLT